MSKPQEFDIVPLRRAAGYLVEKPKAVIPFRRQEHIDQITVLVDSDFAGDPVSRNSTTGLVGGADWCTHSEIWIHTSELESAERRRSGVPRSGEGRSSWTSIEIYLHASGNLKDS